LLSIVLTANAAVCADLAHGRVTVSTVGIISKIRKMTHDLPEVSLALSLHAPNQEMRSTIVPTAKHYPIEELIESLDAHMMSYVKRRRERAAEERAKRGEAPLEENVYTAEERMKESSRRRAMIEYIMLEGPTSTIEAAHQLGRLCEGRQLVVNLIPYNQTDVEDELRCPPKSHMDEFRNIVASYGAFCTFRRTMGADIDSACGQLITLEKETKDKAEQFNAVRDIEDVVTSDTVKKAASKPKSSERSLESEKGAPTRSLEQFIWPLTVATIGAASCFVLSSALFIRQRNR
jgi:adenine C2-methylase RlmN of 23S rRNA A2503 and tRNA A37